MDFFSSDTPAEELQRPIFISQEKLRGVWVMDMTTEPVLLPMMRSVCPSSSISMMILSPPVWLTCLVVCLPIVVSVCLSICFYCESVCLSARPRVILHLSLYACQKLKKYNVILVPLPSTTRPNNGCNVRLPGQCGSFTWSIHLVFWTTIASLCIPSVVVLNVPLCGSELPLHSWCH